MTENPGVTLQINLAPTDLPHATHTLPHQLRQWGDQVDEILLVVDLHRSRGRYADGWEQRLPGLRQLIADCCSQYAHARTVDVDYAPEIADEIAATYFGGVPVPAKDCFGAPFYAYFFALHAARQRYVFHMDSDMMYGGGSPTWLAEAVALMTERPDVLVCSPLPGPPTADGSLTSQTLPAEPHTSRAFRADGVSTRLLMIDMERLRDRVGTLTLSAPGRLHRWEAVADGNPAFEPAEQVLSHAMVGAGMYRVDFLGDAPGMWSIHPPYRSALFYERLPQLVTDIEAGRIPEGQRGDHDMNDSMVSWASARQPRWRRVQKHQRLLVRNVASKLIHT